MTTFSKQQLVRKLTRRMDLHRIFLFSYPYLGEERSRLLLVVNPVKGLAPKTMAPIVSLCLSDSEDIPFDLVRTSEWKNQLKQGSLYYTYASLPGHELYSTAKKGNPLFSHKTLTGLLELAELTYEKCRKGSDEFREGVDNFVAKGDYSRATFMLHQVMELRLKGFLATAGMNGGTSHNVEHLIKRVQGVLPQLQVIFPYDSPLVNLLRLLDQSYTKAKKQESIEIGAEACCTLRDKCEQAGMAMDKMVASMAARIKAYRKQGSKTVENQASPVIYEDFNGFPWPEAYKRDVNSLLNRIRQSHHPEQVTMLNYHAEGFSGDYLFRSKAQEDTEGRSKIVLYLAVLMNNKGPFHFRHLQVGMACAKVVYLNLKTVEKNLTEGNRFFHTLWMKGRVLWRKTTFEPAFEVVAMDNRLAHKRAEKTWRNAKTCLDNLNSQIQNAPVLKLDTFFLLLRNLLEIGVSTYLQCTMGFLPHGVDLAELIEWSGVADRSVQAFIFPENEIETARMKLILNPHTVWWQNMEIGLSNTSQPFYKDRAAEIVQFFTEVCENAVRELAGKVSNEIS